MLDRSEVDAWYECEN